jgi:hypothetical protein
VTRGNGALAGKTRNTNAGKPVDFESSIDPDDEPASVNPNVDKLQQIADAIEAGQAQVGRLYRLADYSGDAAYAAKARVGKQRNQWPELSDGFEWRFKVKRDRAGNQSHLYGGVVAVKP